MNKANEQLIRQNRKYQNKWVAIDKNTRNVIYSSKDLKNLIKVADVKSSEYILEKVLPIDSAFIIRAY